MQKEVDEKLLEEKYEVGTLFGYEYEVGAPFRLGGERGYGFVFSGKRRRDGHKVVIKETPKKMSTSG